MLAVSVPGKQSEYNMTVLTGPKPDYTLQDASTYKANIDNAISDLADNVGVALKRPPVVHIPLVHNLAYSGTGFLTYERTGEATYINRYKEVVKVGADVPRFEREGYLTEKNIGNYCLHSEDITNVEWFKSNVTETGNDTTAPDGTLTADKILETTANGVHKIVNSLSPVTVAGDLTGSAFVKGGLSRNNCRLYVGNATDGRLKASFNITGDGSVVSSDPGVDAQIIALRNGWYRVAISVNRTTANSDLQVVIENEINQESYVGVITNGLYVWGMQLEDCPTLTSYIPTVASVVFRQRDKLSLTYDGNWPDHPEFSIVLDHDRFPFNDRQDYILYVDPIRIYWKNLVPGTLRVDGQGILLTETAGWATDGSRQRIGVTYDGITIRVYRDGIEVGSTANTPSNSTLRLDPRIGWDGSASQPNGHISNLRVFDFALSAAQMRAM